MQSSSIQILISASPTTSQAGCAPGQYHAMIILTSASPTMSQADCARRQYHAMINFTAAATLYRYHGIAAGKVYFNRLF